LIEGGERWRAAPVAAAPSLAVGFANTPIATARTLGALSSLSALSRARAGRANSLSGNGFLSLDKPGGTELADYFF
jgi:hypothetical protein